MSQPTSPAPAQPAKPARSPVERVIVWGVIAVGLGIVGIEAKSHLAHAAALGELQSKVKENSEKDVGITKKDVDAVVGGRIPTTEKLNPMATSMGAASVDIYAYDTWLKERRLYVYYGIKGKKDDQPAEVMEVGAGPAETIEQAMAKMPKPEAGSSITPPGMGTNPGPGGPGGGTGGGGGRGTGGGGGRGRNRPAGEESPADKPATDGEENTADKDKPDTEAKADAPKADEPTADEPKADTEKPAETEPKNE